MFARKLDHCRSKAGWGSISNAAHPGLPKTSLQISGPSYGRQRPAPIERLYKILWCFTLLPWQKIDEGILPALYAADTP